MLLRNTKKSDFGSYSLYLVMHEVYSFGIVPAAFRYDISKSHAAYGRVEGCSVVVQHKKV